MNRWMTFWNSRFGIVVTSVGAVIVVLVLVFVSLQEKPIQFQPTQTPTPGVVLPNLLVTPVPLVTSTGIEADHCYIQDLNEKWALIIPHWEQAQAVYALEWANADAEPFLVFQSENANQWETLSDQAGFVSVIVSHDDGTWSLDIYDLEVMQQVAHYSTGYGTQMESFGATSLIFHDLGGEETTPRWFTILYGDWNAYQISSRMMDEPQRLVVSDAVSQIIHERFDFCGDWPTFVENPTPTP